MPILIALALAAAAQSSDKLPPANPLPPPTSEEGQVLAPIEAVFAAFESGDAVAMLRYVYPDGRVTAASDRGVRRMSFSEFAARVKPDATFQERITDPAIDIDGDIAMVWAPFTVRVGGKITSCGIDHFDLIRESGVWKIMNISFSSRTTGCPAQ
ncbi:MAG: nuclear transport factor 2 family protein [Sphingomonas sp.]|nr:nuclear transport factor 2 family protein [Sphingomonas sp.]